MNPGEETIDHLTTNDGMDGAKLSPIFTGGPRV